MSREYFINCVEEFINKKNITEDFVIKEANSDERVFLFGGGARGRVFY